MKILAIETSSPMISVAVADSGRLRSEISQTGNASTLLAPAIQKVLRDAGLKLQQIDAFAIGEGPGSYNGLRCGFATVAGLILPAPRPVVQVNSLASMVVCAIANRKSQIANEVGVILNARKQMFFYQKFRMEKEAPTLQEEAMVERLEEIPGLESGGTCWLSYDVAGFQPAFPSAATAVQLGFKTLSALGFDGKLGEPRYLRPPV